VTQAVGGRALTHATEDTLLAKTIRDFNAALARLNTVGEKLDYPEAYKAALEAVRWVYDAREGEGALDQLNESEVSQRVFAKRLPRTGVSSTLREFAFSAEAPPPALLLYAADILEGKNFGPTPRPTQVAIAEVDLLVRIGMLHEQHGSLQKAYAAAAREGLCNGNADSVARAYRRAKRNRSTG